jgi:cold shock protein
MQEGIIAKITENGFGFIKVEGREKDLFVHTTDIEGGLDSLREGDKVSFEVATKTVDGVEKQNAVKVSKVG